MADHPHVDTCPICAEPLNDDDICATDIEMGICHAACLDGSPTVDLETGEPTDGPIHTYRYGDTAPTSPSGAVNDQGSNGETLERVCKNDPDNDPKNENIADGDAE